MILNKFTIILRYSLALLIFIAVIGGCTRKKSISGKEYIEKETLVDLLTDLHMVDAVTNDMKFYRKFNPEDSVDLYSDIFKKYNVTPEKYKKTIEEYSKYPELLDKVYDEVLMQLNLMQDRIEQADDENIEVIDGERKRNRKRE